MISMLRALVVVLFASALSCHAQEHRLLPVDEGAADPSWVRFRTQLLDAVARRDQKFVTSIVDRRIRNISPQDGPAEFRKLWEPHAADSPLWVQLPKLLYLGSAYVKRDK